MNTDYKYEPDLDDILDNARVRIYKLYHRLDAILSVMVKELKKAGDFPEDFTREDAIRVQNFLEEIDNTMEEYGYIFDKFDDECGIYACGDSSNELSLKQEKECLVN